MSIRKQTQQLIEAYETFVTKRNYNLAVACAVNLYNTDKQKYYKYIRGIRNRLRRDNKADPIDVRNMLYRTYIATARDKFDDFMVALEWNRPIEQKFWEPRRQKLLNVCECLQKLEDDELDELLLSLPPRVGKTTLVMFFILWVILRHPENSNLYSSYSDTVVGTFYTGLIEILNDPVTYLWKEIFPDRTVASTNSKDRLINIDRMKKYASMTCRSLYGTLNGSVDCNGYEIADDLISGIEEAMNKDRLISAWSKVENNFLPRGKGSTKHLWIGTRWSIYDPAGMRLDLLQNDEKFSTIRWKQINVPAMNEKDESNFDYECGVGFSSELYQQRRASFERNGDMASWLAQYQGEPVEREGTVFAPDELRYFNGELPRDIDPDRIFMSVDPAWGGGDYVAGCIIFQYGEDLFVKDVVFDDSDKSKTQPMLARCAKYYHVQAMYIEATKMTGEYADGVDQILRSQDYKLNMIKTTSHWTGNGKAQRIFDKAPDIREHMIFIESGRRNKMYEMFMNNVFSFSITGKVAHDDAPDCLAMAMCNVMYGDNTVRLVSRKGLGF